MPDRLKAALMVSHDLVTWRTALAELNAYAERRGWTPAAWVQTWTDLVAATNRCRWCGMGGGSDVGIIPTPGSVPPNRLPRLVIMSEEPIRRRGQVHLPQQRRTNRRSLWDGVDL